MKRETLTMMIIVYNNVRQTFYLVIMWSTVFVTYVKSLASLITLIVQLLEDLYNIHPNQYAKTTLYIDFFFNICFKNAEITKGTKLDIYGIGNRFH